jgi:hypothetical protein
VTPPANSDAYLKALFGGNFAGRLRALERLLVAAGHGNKPGLWGHLYRHLSEGSENQRINVTRVQQIT